VKDIDIFAGTISNLPEDVSQTTSSNHIILDGIRGRYLSHYRQIDANNWVFGTLNTGIILNGQNSELKNCDLKYSAGNGVSLGGKYNQVINCTISEVDYAATEAAGIFTDQIFSRNKPERDNTGLQISYNTVYNTGRSGIVHRKIKASKIIGNLVYDVGWQTADLGAFYTYDTDADNTEIAYNIARDNHAAYIGLGLYFDSGSTNYVVHHNLMYGKNAAIQWNAPIPNKTVGTSEMRFYNNTIAIADSPFGDPYPDNESLMSGEIKNNIFVQPPAYGKVKTWAVDISNNLNGDIDPQFADPANSNYQLRSGSPAIDGGIDLGEYTKEYKGNAPDIGAYEYGSKKWQAGRANLD